MKIGILLEDLKESIYSLDLLKNHEAVCLIHISGTSSWTSQNSDFLKLLAKAVNLPLIHRETSPEKKKEILEEALEEAKKKYKIRGLAAGITDSLYRKTMIETICNTLKLKTFFPLWHRTQLNIIEDMIDENYKIRIVSIDPYLTDSAFLGENFDKDILNNIINNNPSFEGIETVVFFAPIFYKKIIIKKFRKEIKEGKEIYLVIEAELK